MCCVYMDDNVWIKMFYSYVKIIYNYFESEREYCIVVSKLLYMIILLLMNEWYFEKYLGRLFLWILC